MALSGDDRLLESMQEFRISRRADHILGIRMTTSSESTEHQTDKTGKETRTKDKGFTQCTKIYKGTLELLFMEKQVF